MKFVTLTGVKTQRILTALWAKIMKGMPKTKIWDQVKLYSHISQFKLILT